MSSFLIDTVIHALDKARETGADPSGILVIAPSKESGARLRRELSERLEDYAAQTSMVRSVHSLAFALLRTAAEEELRLITGAEQDAVIRELLTGQAEDGHGSWPAEMRPRSETLWPLALAHSRIAAVSGLRLTGAAVPRGARLR